LNIKSAYLHLFSDALVSLGIVIGGVLIIYTKWSWIDPLLSILIVLAIFWSTWSLFRDSLRLSMDGVPRDINLEVVKKIFLVNPQVRSIHHMHIWSMSTSEIAMTAHVVLQAGLSDGEVGEVKKSIRHELADLSIHHATLETEQEVIPCDDKDCD
jgi:cobalt-zinc-cadmium efflux system protein